MSRTVLMFGEMLPEIEARVVGDYDLVRAPPRAAAAEVESRLAEVRAVVTGGGTGLSTDWFDRLPRLGLVAVNGGGTDKVNLAEDVADLGMALILGVLRRLGEGDRIVRAGRAARSCRSAPACVAGGSAFSA